MKRIPLFRVRMSAKASPAVADVLASGYVGEGPQVKCFERALSEALQHPYVLALNSGTSALKVAYELAGIKPGDVVCTTPLTCLATNMPLLRMGATIRWVDVDPETGGMSPGPRKPPPYRSTTTLWEALETQPYPSVVVVCDWGGDVGALTEIRRLCTHHGVPLIEDAAHAFGATVECGAFGVTSPTPGQGARDGEWRSSAAGVPEPKASQSAVPTGGIADFTAFSFQAIKLLTTIDGGALTTLHAHDRERGRLLRWFGLDRDKGESMRCYQQVPFAGDKYQLHDVAAAIGLANLEGIADALAAQRENATYYDTALDPACITPLRRHPGSACWLYSVRVPDARSFIAEMDRRGIECSQVHARNDVQRIFAAYRTSLPGMDVLERQLVCIPVGWWLTTDDRRDVAMAANAVAAGERKAA